MKKGTTVEDRKSRITYEALEDAVKRFKKVENATAMLWKLLKVAEKNFRGLKGYWLLPDVYEGKSFINGVIEDVKSDAERKAA